jgi:hypothetical protein
MAITRQLPENNEGENNGEEETVVVISINRRKRTDDGARGRARSARVLGSLALGLARSASLLACCRATDVLRRCARAAGKRGKRESGERRERLGEREWDKEKRGREDRGRRRWLGKIPGRARV